MGIESYDLVTDSHDGDTSIEEAAYTAACPVPGFPICIRADGSLRAWDESICREVLELDTYRLRELKAQGAELQYCLDVGGHIGVSTALIKRLWPEARMIVVEPDSENFHLLRQNTAVWPDVVCVDGAVSGSHAGHVAFRSFAVVLDSGNSGIGEVRTTAGEGTIPVPAWTVEELLIRYGFPRIDLLKLDCEGSEGAILEETRRDGILERIGWIRGEWHGHDQREAVVKALSPTHTLETTENGNIGLFFAGLRHFNRKDPGGSA
jgi:FkbM family methyltransferase